MSERIYKPGANAPKRVTLDADAIVVTSALPPDLAETLDSVRSFLTRYIVFSSTAQSTIVTLWIAHTHAFAAADFTPYLHVSSPDRECGKTLLLESVKLLVARPWGPVVQPSEAVVFRMISEKTPTLLLDEADTIFTGGKSDANREGLRALLNAGYQRGGSVPRCVGKNFELREFQVFCPKLIAGIGNIPGTVAGRSIPIRLARKAPEQQAEKFRSRTATDLAEPIRAALERWPQAAVLNALRDARPNIPETLGARQADIAEPLLAIADMAGDPWSEDARKALLDIYGSADNQGSDSDGVLTLRAIKTIFAERQTDRIHTDDLLDALCQRDEGPWAAWWSDTMRHGNTRGPSARLAKILRPYGIVSRAVRIEEKNLKGYLAESFANAWASYCRNSPEDVTTSQL